MAEEKPLICKLKVPSGRVVRFRALTIEEEMIAFRVVGDVDNSRLAKQTAIGLEFLRMAIVSIDGKTLSYEQLAGKGLYAQLDTKDLKVLQGVYARKFGDPDELELAGFLKTAEMEI